MPGVRQMIGRQIANDRGEAVVSPAVLDNQAAYIANWIAALRTDSRILVSAAAAAQKAADLVLGRSAAESETQASEPRTAVAVLLAA